MIFDIQSPSSQRPRRTAAGTTSGSHFPRPSAWEVKNMFNCSVFPFCFLHRNTPVLVLLVILVRLLVWIPWRFEIME